MNGDILVFEAEWSVHGQAERSGEVQSEPVRMSGGMDLPIEEVSAPE